MPTKKRRVGFIPRSDVFDLINRTKKLESFTNSKVSILEFSDFIHISPGYKLIKNYSSEGLLIFQLQPLKRVDNLLMRPYSSSF